MPYDWVEPEVLVKLPDGRKIYHAYKDNEIQAGVLSDRICLNECDEEHGAVDITDWPGYEFKWSLEENIRAAYAHGDIYWDEELEAMLCSWDDTPERIATGEI